MLLNVYHLHTFKLPDLYSVLEFEPHEAEKTQGGKKLLLILEALFPFWATYVIEFFLDVYGP